MPELFMNGRGRDAVTLVGGAPLATPVLEDALTRAPRLLAADGGADACLARGLVPERVVGDMDSLSPEAARRFADRLVPVPEQDSTDFAKALRGLDAPFVLAVGFLAARVDHALAAFSHLAERGGAAPPAILLSEHDCIALLPPRIDLALQPGDRVSLWPLGPVRARSSGLRWPLEGIALDPAGRVGTSNRAEGAVRLECRGPCLLILDHARLPALLAGLGRGAAPG
ncbi:thiamine diphosphokinase [Jannaschia sp. W003]|uniref:thiamine diphosphokinase n=1 Tax=Jannaschia sp. W003 TaxID=2867012 RepID=UPI0021A4AEB8|nr:thiamine diphosphokinase [Jannaschia sp. W003]UWQ22775.1 thiamine diphosphokinase [Jannaschia sp. W003]